MYMLFKSRNGVAVMVKCFNHKVYPFAGVNYNIIIASCQIFIVIGKHYYWQIAVIMKPMKLKIPSINGIFVKFIGVFKMCRI